MVSDASQFRRQLRAEAVIVSYDEDLNSGKAIFGGSNRLRISDLRNSKTESPEAETVRENQEIRSMGLELASDRFLEGNRESRYT